MTSPPSDALIWEVQQFNALPDYPSSVHSGINGDQSHFSSNSYHIGISELPSPGGYTNRTWEDQMPNAGSSWHASATDESMNTSDMILNWNRHLAVFNDHSDPRRQYLAEYIGWNGVGSAERLDFQGNTRTSASADHKWHRHRAKRRRYYNSMTAATACLSVDKGETKEQYLISIGQGPAPAPGGEEDDMIMFHTTDDAGTAATTDDAVAFALLSQELELRVKRAPAQTLANKIAGHPNGSGNSVSCSKQEWNDLMDWMEVPEGQWRHVTNADGTLGDWQEQA